MDPDQLRALLERVRTGSTAVESAIDELRSLPFADLGYARVDHHRALRMGIPEVVLARGKTVEQIAGIVEQLIAAGQNVLVTRLEQAEGVELVSRVPAVKYQPFARVATFEQRPIAPRTSSTIPVVTAGTSDSAVAAEALETLRMCGIPGIGVYDVGVAGLHRLLDKLDVLRKAPAVIVVAGMEGALPSVVGGLIGTPIVAVPTSIGYGAALGGLTALFGMLTGCASGVTVVNIDNGFGAAMAIMRMLFAKEQGATL